MVNISLSRYLKVAHQPTRAQILKYIRRSLVQRYQNVMINVAIVDANQSQELNLAYRNIDKPTNVISLEYASSRDNFNFLSGELILCDEVIVSEANQQGKSIAAHYAHMIIHGVLHLQGYDHQNDHDAEEMEQLEIEILQTLNFNNPYLEVYETI